METNTLIAVVLMGAGVLDLFTLPLLARFLEGRPQFRIIQAAILGSSVLLIVLGFSLYAGWFSL